MTAVHSYRQCRPPSMGRAVRVGLSVFEALSQWRRYHDGQAWASSHVVCATAQHITKASTGEGTAAHVVQPSATLQGGLVTQRTFGCVEKLLDDHHGGPLRVRLWLRKGPRARVGEALQVITHGGGDDEGAGDEQRALAIEKTRQT